MNEQYSVFVNFMNEQYLAFENSWAFKKRKMYVIMSYCVMCNNINLEEDDDNNDIIANDNETTDK